MDRLDTERHAAIIIPTVLSNSAVEDWEWVFRMYGWKAIQKWMEESGHAETRPPPIGQ